MRLSLQVMVGVALVIAGADPSRAAPSGVATISANIVRPLTLAWLQNLDLGSVVLGPGTWSGATVQISRASVFSCSNSNVTCTGPTQPAKYNATGTNNQ